MKAVTLETLAHTHAQDNLINKEKHKDMMYLCDFKMLKII